MRVTKELKIFASSYKLKFSSHLCDLNILTIVQAVATASLNPLSGFGNLGPLVVTEV